MNQDKNDLTNLFVVCSSSVVGMFIGAFCLYVFVGLIYTILLNMGVISYGDGPEAASLQCSDGRGIAISSIFVGAIFGFIAGCVGSIISLESSAGGKQESAS